MKFLLSCMMLAACLMIGGFLLNLMMLLFLGLIAGIGATCQAIGELMSGERQESAAKPSLRREEEDSM